MEKKKDKKKKWRRKGVINKEEENPLPDANIRKQTLVSK
jgi:hypothetical protein